MARGSRRWSVKLKLRENPGIVGAGASGGIGVFFTNAKDVTELKRPFHTMQLNTPWFSAQYDESNGVRVFSFTVGPGIGASYYGGNTATKTTKPFVTPLDLMTWQK